MVRMGLDRSKYNTNTNEYDVPAIVLAGCTTHQPNIPPNPLVAKTTDFGRGGGVSTLLVEVVVDVMMMFMNSGRRRQTCSGCVVGGSRSSRRNRALSVPRGLLSRFHIVLSVSENARTNKFKRHEDESMRHLTTSSITNPLQTPVGL